MRAEASTAAEAELTLGGACAESLAPLTVWVGLLAQALMAAAGCVACLLGFALFPLMLLLPSGLLEGAARGCFRLGYLAYLTEIGAAVHTRMLAARRRWGRGGEGRTTQESAEG